MPITEETITFTCPSCGHTSRRRGVIKDLSEGKKPLCDKCGREIPIDRDVMAKIEELLQRLGLGDAAGAPLAGHSSTVSIRCPGCGASSVVGMTLDELEAKDRIFCQSCGKEIPIDHEKIRRAQHALAGLSGVAGEGGTIDTPEGPVVVTSKTFNVDIKREIDDGKAALAGGAVPTSGASRPNAIGPKRGCFGVLATLTVTLAVAAALVCALA